MSRRIFSVDIETTGLNHHAHDAWEVAVVPLGDPKGGVCYQFYTDLRNAEVPALKVGDFVNRYGGPFGEPSRDYALQMTTVGLCLNEDGHMPTQIGSSVPVDKVKRALQNVLSDATLLGAAVHFDAAFLDQLLGASPWHHRHLDLGSFAAGAWGAKDALSSKAMSDRVPNAHPHTALGDALWNIEVYEKIVNG